MFNIARKVDWSHCNMCFQPFPRRGNGEIDVPLMLLHKRECFGKNGFSMVQGEKIAHSQLEESEQRRLRLKGRRSGK